jgi:hypothetical protein
MKSVSILLMLGANMNNTGNFLVSLAVTKSPGFYSMELVRCNVKFHANCRLLSNYYLTTLTFAEVVKCQWQNELIHNCGIKTGGNWSIRRKSCASATLSTWHWMTWDRTRTSAVLGRRLTASAEARHWWSATVRLAADLITWCQPYIGSAPKTVKWWPRLRPLNKRCRSISTYIWISPMIILAPVEV